MKSPVSIFVQFRVPILMLSHQAVDLIFTKPIID